MKDRDPGENADDHDHDHDLDQGEARNGFAGGPVF